ncbi:hypothetical protein TIFTF001_015167 [Ficus carica]|uniref:Uncharacterized protein n=1 Tax=Ficus carica TaxID=3494 RepID=A0AA88AS64_FICCA|nr:hypothetical protein TIFTF001_015167 [Ficus carica]
MAEGRPPQMSRLCKGDDYAFLRSPSTAKHRPQCDAPRVSAAHHPEVGVEANNLP